MKKILIFVLGLCIYSASSSQTLYVPNATSGISTSPNGNVGIGHSNPDMKLDVRTSKVYISRFHYTNTSTFGGIRLGRSSSYADLVTSSSGFGIGVATTGSGLPLNSQSASNINFFISNNSGNVGIGTASPLSTLNINGGTGSITTGLTFGDGNTGFYESADNTLITTIGGTNTFYWAGNLFRAAKTSAPALMNEVASSTNPTLVPSNSDQDTGVGWSTTNQLSLITGGSEAVRINSDGKVGIGTINPLSQLSIQGDGATIGSAAINFKHSGNGMSIGLGTTSNNLMIGNSWNPESGTYLTIQEATGKIGIGTSDFSGNHKLRVEGSIGAREIKVEATGWSDFVFENGYELRTLEEVEKHIKENGHLPEIPSEVEVAENGIYLGEMDAKLLQKIEELTLYMIDMNKQVQSLKSENKELKEKVQRLENE